jgi:hypothetical protein
MPIILNIYYNDRLSTGENQFAGRTNQTVPIRPLPGDYELEPKKISPERPQKYTKVNLHLHVEI